MSTQVHCLRYSKSFTEIIEVSTQITSKHPNLPVWGPVMDGAMGFIPRMPHADRLGGFYSKVPLLVGLVRDEGADEAQKLLPTVASPNFPDSFWHSGVSNFIAQQLAVRTQDVYDELKYRYTWWGNTENETARRQEFIDVFIYFTPFAFIEFIDVLCFHFHTPLCIH